jgi:hypothetical protein
VKRQDTRRRLVGRGRSHCLGGIGARTRHEVPVDVFGDPDRGVAQLFGDDLHVSMKSLSVTKSVRLSYPHVRERAADGLLVTVTCPVLKFSPDGYLKFIDLGVGRSTLRHRSRRPCLASRCSVGPLAHPPALVRCDFHIPSRLPSCTSYTLPCGTLALPFSLRCSFDLTSQL